MIANNYHNKPVNFEIDQRIKFIDDNGQIFSAVIVGIQAGLLDLYFEDTGNSQGLESPTNCFHV
jgi:hypothetical protein